MTSYFKSKRADDADTVYDNGIRMLEGQITKVHFIDEATNRSKQYVEYDVLARSALGGATTYKNCRYVQDISGFNDSSETVLEANNAALKGKLDPSNSPANMNGTMVVLAFLDGSIAKPVIIGGFRHGRSTGATKEDGIRKIRTFRGVSIEINKDGEYTITQSSPNSPDGKQTNKDLNSEVKLDKNGRVTFTVGGNGLEAVWDGKNDQIVYSTKGGPYVAINGNGNITISVNETKIIIDGQTGKISLTGNLVDVGKSASALAALGPQLVSWLSSHTHLYNPGPGGPTPSAPPTVPPPSSVLSTTVKIKA